MNLRKCIHCDQPIKTSDVIGWVTENDAAWLAGFCSCDCMHANARDVVEEGRAWWQAHD